MSVLVRDRFFYQNCHIAVLEDGLKFLVSFYVKLVRFSGPVNKKKNDKARESKRGLKIAASAEK